MKRENVFLRCVVWLAWLLCACMTGEHLILAQTIEQREPTFSADMAYNADSCQHNDPGDRCLIPITLYGWYWSGTFNLCEYCNDYDLEPCTGYPSNAADMVFEVTFPWWMQYSYLYLTVYPHSNWDIAFAYTHDCGDFGPTSCISGHDVYGPGFPEVLYLDPVEVDTYYVVVSGYMTDCGVFSLCFSSYLPVELVSFEGLAGDRKAKLTWTTASETDNDHFYLLRKTEESDYSRISGDIPATNSPTGSSYSYVDYNLVNGITYYYKLVDVDINGLEHINDPVVSVTPMITARLAPEQYTLHQNYPNPFNAVTKIRYDVKEDGFVTLTVSDILGREVAVLVSDFQEAATHVVDLDAANIPSGIYFYQLKVNNFTDLKKMVVLK
jgi:hypothetical protein